MSRLSISSLLAIIAFLFTITFAPAVGAIEEPGLNLTKLADKISAGLGDNITYTYIIKNTDNVSIGSLKLLDDKLGPILLGTDVLAAGDNLTVTQKYTVRIADFQQSVISNNATVTGIRSNGDNITASDNVTVTLVPYKAVLTINKTVDKATASPHETVIYTYEIKNTGDVTINELKLIDDKLGTIILTVNSLQAGENIVTTAPYVISVDDLPGPLINIATISGLDSLKNPVSGTSNKCTLNLNKALMTKAEILKQSGVPGKGIATAPGLQKPFNPKSSAADNAGKKKTK